MPELTEAGLRLLRTVPLPHDSQCPVACVCQPQRVPPFPSSLPCLSPGSFLSLPSFLASLFTPLPSLPSLPVFPPSYPCPRSLVSPRFCLHTHARFCPASSLKAEVHLAHAWLVKGLVSDRGTPKLCCLLPEFTSKTGLITTSLPLQGPPLDL